MDLGMGLNKKKGLILAKSEDMLIKFPIPAGGKTIQLPLTGICNCTIYWGDGTVTYPEGNLSYPSAECTHFYEEGTFLCRIKGTADRFGYSNSTEWEGGRLSPYILSFGRQIQSFVGAFAGCRLASIPKYLPEQITSLSFMFSKCSGDISNCQYWNTSNITNMSRFVLYTPQDPNVENYDVSSVSDFVSFATGNTGFNQYLGKWKLRTIGTNMYGFANVATTGWVSSKIEPTIISWANYVKSTYNGKSKNTPKDVQLGLPNIELTSTIYPDEEIETYDLGENAFRDALSAHTFLITGTEFNGAGWTISFG
jgi:hypothetical protein